MAVTKLPFANGFYESESVPLSAQECTNWYVNIPQAPALNEEVLYRTPGALQLATTGAVAQVNRGAWVMNGIPYFVNGGNLYRLNSDDTTDSLGAVEGTGRVSMADNGTQLCVLNPGGKGYIFTESPDTFTEITDADFTANGNPQHVKFVDSYFVFTTDTKKFIISETNNGLSYIATDAGTAEANPDATVVPFVFKNQLFIMGSETGEGFNNIGGADFPFTRSGIYFDKGVSSPFSIINANDTFMWIGGGKNESPAIWQFAGGQTQKVSTTAIDSLLQDLSETDLGNVFSWSYAEKGAYFVGFTLPMTTLVVDTITGRWHERKSTFKNVAGIAQNVRFRANSVVKAYGKILIGDSIDGRIGHLSKEYLDEYGNAIIRRTAGQPFQNNMESFSVPTIEMTTESGAGNSNVPDPQIEMDISTNGGKTFKMARKRSLGKVGEYKKRTIWRRNGRMPRTAVLRFTMSDAVDTSLLQLTAEIV